MKGEKTAGKACLILWPGSVEAPVCCIGSQGRPSSEHLLCPTSVWPTVILPNVSSSPLLEPSIKFPLSIRALKEESRDKLLELQEEKVENSRQYSGQGWKPIYYLYNFPLS